MRAMVGAVLDGLTKRPFYGTFVRTENPNVSEGGMSETLSIQLGKVEKRLREAEISATRFLEIFQVLITCLTIV